MAEPLRQHAIALLPRPCRGEMRSIESIPPSPQKEKPQQNTGAFFVSIRPHYNGEGFKTEQEGSNGCLGQNQLFIHCFHPIFRNIHTRVKAYE